LVIIKSILAAEQKSYVYHYFENNNQKLVEIWCPLVFQKITEGCEINQFIERLKDIYFIIFNYDQCFEYYMINAINTYYKIGVDNAKKL